MGYDIDRGGWDGGDAERNSVIEAMGGTAPSAPSSAASADFDLAMSMSPTAWQSARMAFGLLSSPISGMYGAVKYNNARMAAMTPDQVAAERGMRAQIEASQSAHGYGTEVSSSYVNPFAKPRFVPAAVPVSGGAGAGDGSGGGAGEMVATGADQAGAGGSGAGPSALIVSGDSSLAKLAALATIAGVLIQAMG